MLNQAAPQSTHYARDVDSIGLEHSGRLIEAVQNLLGSNRPQRQIRIRLDEPPAETDRSIAEAINEFQQVVDDIRESSFTILHADWSLLQDRGSRWLANLQASRLAVLQARCETTIEQGRCDLERLCCEVASELQKVMQTMIERHRRVKRISEACADGCNQVDAVLQQYLRRVSARKYAPSCDSAIPKFTAVINDQTLRIIALTRKLEYMTTAS